ncbi:MAG: hypothetical protein ACXWJW_02460 [Xanthobacteraceae bacterium]
MRRFTVAGAIVEALILISAIVSASNPARRLDPASLYGLLFFFVVPAFGLAILDRRLKFAVFLVCLVAFMLFSILVASQISS